MKAKYKKIIAFSLAAAVIAAVSAYTWLPGTKTVARQGVKATKAAAAHYLSTDAVDASNIRQVITADSTTSRTFMWRTTPKRILSSNTAKPVTIRRSCSSPLPVTPSATMA